MEPDVPPSKAAGAQVKAELHRAILKIVKARGYSQRDLQEILRKPQPRISELLNGKISGVSIEKLLDYLIKLGASPKVHVRMRKAA